MYPESMQTRAWLVFLLVIFPLLRSFGLAPSLGAKHVLLLNSYHQGYEWTDSIEAGIQTELKLYPHVSLYTFDLDAKRFGSRKQEADKQFIQKKYAGVELDGILVTDNDALDFVLKYKSQLFPEIPVVFAGISNTRDYSFEGTAIYGFEETANSDSALLLIQKIIPEARKIFVLVDNTTTGKVYRREFLNLAQKSGLTIDFPDSSDISSVMNLDFTAGRYDAVYYAGISEGENGTFIPPDLALKLIAPRVEVPLFSNDPKYIGLGVLGGTFQRGIVHGRKMIDLLMKLLDPKVDRKRIAHVNYTGQNYFFDSQLLRRYSIPADRIPANAILYNVDHSFREKYRNLLWTILGVLVVAVVILSVVNRRRRVENRRTRLHAEKMELQKRALEDAHERLSLAIDELERANRKLNESNLELAAAKKKAEESDRLKSAFLANVSHELRTPLNSIVGFSSLLAEGVQDEKSRKTYINLVESNTESLLVLIDEIIDLSKIEAQQLAVAKQEFNLGELLLELEVLYSKNSQEGGPALVLKTPIPPVELLASSDRVRVRQILINLLSNAFKFTEAGLVEFGYFLSGKRIILYVKDTGIGISKEYHQEIFHRFRKLNENSSKVFRGTGLGLAITQKLIELLGGQIWLESAPGEGSTFYFTIAGLTVVPAATA